MTATKPTIAAVLPQSRIPASRRPTKEELEAATALVIPDVIDSRLRVLICGINPGLYSAAIGHHYGRPGNRMWNALADSGLTPRVFSPYEEVGLLKFGIGFTDLVRRATAAAAELGVDELERGGRELAAKAQRFQPHIIAIAGIGAYRGAFTNPKATLGLQPESIGPCPAWVLPNPSGLNAHYNREALAVEFSKLKAWLDCEPSSHHG